ncbi:NACHT domain-containing protein [Streptomyces virginiae]|uniref:NACHT domain-containing protein n=1 Tax=Streptomyces virginiae TaxID=1961 RepID=UPI0035DD0A2A
MAGCLLLWGLQGAESLEKVLAAFGMVLALPAAVMAVVFRTAGTSDVPPLEDVADQLALRVRHQWENEERVRRLNDPYPLPVEWEAADSDLVEAWPLVELAADRPDSSRDETAEWALVAGLPDGARDAIRQAFERIPTRRLVVLGEPGAGKTMFLVRLLLAQLEQRPPGGPVPALFSLASWDPARQDLYTWMADQLARDHPALDGPVPDSPAQSGRQTWASTLVQGRRILPILDGLDELPEAARGRALHAINQVLSPGQPLVLSSRTAEYRKALIPPTGVPMLLNGAAGIQLLSLGAVQAAAYLQRDAGGSHTAAAARWDRVCSALGSEAPAAQALSTPLGLFLARSIYNPRPGDEYPADFSHPDELLDRARFPTRRDVDAHLYRAFIPASYSRHHRHASPWTVKQAERTFAFLARHLEYTLHGTPNLAWWHLSESVPWFALAPGIVFGLAFGLAAGITVGALVGLNLGAMGAFMATLLLTLSPACSPAASVRWSWREHLFLRMLLSVGLGAALGTLGLVIGDREGRFALFCLALGFVAGGLISGLTSVPPDLNKTVGPGSILRRDRRTFWAVMLTTVVVSCLILGILAQVWDTRVRDALVSGLLLSIIWGLGFAQFGGARSVWLVFLLTRIQLAALGRVPWRLMSFLADAHEHRGVLRQVGAVYQFRHIDLQRHLAGPPPRRRHPPRWPPRTPGRETLD